MDFIQDIGSLENHWPIGDFLDSDPELRPYNGAVQDERGGWDYSAINPPNHPIINQQYRKGPMILSNLIIGLYSY